jgi:cell wall-associated NlpC family hydrolase
MIKASQLIAWIKKHVGDGYVYGSIGQICSVNLLKNLQAQYGTSMGDGYYQKGGDFTKGRCGKWIGKWVCDCSGLIKVARKTLDGTWKDVSAQGTYDQCSMRGPISSMPLLPGCAVFMYNKEKGRMGHVGMYIGGDQVIEARGADYGVVITKLSTRSWGFWGQLEWLEYDIKADTGKPVVGTQSDAGDGTNPKADDPLTFKEAIDILSKKSSISSEYWKARENIDPNFAAHEIKIATAIK